MIAQKAFPYPKSADQIPQTVRSNLDRRRQRIFYQCPDSCWTQHLEAWREELKQGNRSAPEPFPFGHLMFESPHAYGMVRCGDESVESERAACGARIRSMLSGWSRGVSPEGLDRIVNEVVDAEMAGVDVGLAPFVACLAAATQRHSVG